MSSKRHKYNIPTSALSSTTVYQSINNPPNEEEYHKHDKSLSPDDQDSDFQDHHSSSGFLINNDLNKPTIDDALNYIGFGPVQVLAFVLSAITAMGFGFELVIFASINIPLQKQWNVSEIEFAILPASTNVANIVGGLFYALLSDRFGRVWPYALVLFHLAISGLGSAFSPNFTILTVLRDIVSIAVTGASTVIFATLVEFLPVKNRGKLMVLVMLAEAIGACVTGGLAWWLIPTYTVNGWRYLLIATSIPFFVGTAYRVIFFIQSPRYLFARGRFKETRKVLKQMAWMNGKNIDNFIPKSVKLEAFIHVEKKTKKTCMQRTKALLAIFDRRYLRTTLLLSVIYVTETVAYFASGLFIPEVLQNFGVNPFFTAFVGYLGQIPGIALISIIIEWPGVGRLNALRLFSMLSIISFLLFAFVRNQIATSVIVVLIYFSMVPMLPLLFTYISEVYPTEIRSFASAYFNNLSCIFGIGCIFASGYLSDMSIPWLFPTVWAGVFLVQFVLALFLNRETLGQELKDVV